MGHTTYGLTMADGLWRATCGCGWGSAPSPDLAEQTDALDRHLRVVVVAEQRPSRVSRVSTDAVLRIVDHTVVLCVMAVAGALAAPLRVRRAHA